jgi:hypothetical protein
MEYIRTLTMLPILAFALMLLLLAFNSSESYGQNDTITGSNQSSSTSNDTAAWSNQSDSGNISGFMRGV